MIREATGRRGGAEAAPYKLPQGRCSVPARGTLHHSTKGESRLRKFLILAAALCLLLAGCGPAPAPEETPAPSPSAAPAAEAAEFALACYPSAGFHPITGSNRTNLSLAGLMYEGLFTLDQEFRFHGVLCASYAVSEDGLTWTFRLREDTVFSDGSPLTAAQVVSSLETARASALYAARFTDIASVAAAEDGAVTVALTRPNGALPALLDIPIVKETGGVPLGTGPYVLTGGESWRLEANGLWRQGAENLPLEAIPLRAIQEADDLIRAFDTRDVTLVSTDLTGTNSLGFSGSFDTVDYPTSVMLYVGFNTASGPCASAAVRQALLRSFDRAAAATVSLSRHAQAAALPASPACSLYEETLADGLAYDAGAAAELLTGAGYTRSDGVWQRRGVPLSLTFAVPANNPHRLAAAELLAASLTDAGIPAELEALPWDDYIRALEAGDFDLYLGEVRLTGDFDLTALIAPGGALNYGRYSSAQAVSLHDAFRAASGTARAQAAARLYEYLAQEPPFAVICFKSWSALVQWNQASGLTPTQQNLFYQFDQWQIS